MKNFFSSFRARQIQVVVLLGLFFATAFQLARRPLYSAKAGWQLPFAGENGEEDENDGDRAYPDRPDLALQQDADLTRDPATGRVPTERLLAAARFNEASLKSQAQQAHRTSAQTLSNAAWVERGPNNVGGRILGLLVEPTDATGNTVWAGSADGGLWKITNATTGTYTWTNVNTNLSNLAVTTIAADPGTTIRYCGTGEGFFNSDAVQGNGIWKSTDDGATWTQLAATNNNFSFNYVQKVLVHPVTHDVYAATRDGLWRSQNGGTNWTRVLGTGTAPTASATNAAADIEIAADNTLFVAFGTIFNSGAIYRSADGNVGNWTDLNTLGGSGLPTTGYERIELACAPSDANRLYAVFQATTGRSLLNIYSSSDKGNTWAVLPRPGGADYTNGQAWYNLAIAVSPADPNTVYVGGLDLWLTNNAGSTWAHESVWSFATTSPFYVHADHHAIAFVPTGTAPANKAFFGSDGGLAYSADASIDNASEPQFSQRNTGFNVTQFFAVAMHPTNFNYFLAGAQDNGTQKFTTAALNATTQATGGDGAFCAIDQNNAAVQFSSYVYNQYRRSLDGGVNFTDFNISNASGSFINPWEYDNQANVLYACYDTDTYLAWTNAGDINATAAATINPGLGAGAGKVTHVSVSPATPNRIYLGTNAGKLLRVDNANTTTPIVTTLLNVGGGKSISCVAIDPANENHQLVTLSNYGAGLVSVYESANANAALPTWTNVEGNLPDMPVRWALFDPRNTTRAILATEMGVYTTVQLNGASTAWSVVSNGPKNVRVDMLRYRPGDKLVAAATHGRGLFTSVIFDPSTPLPVTLTSLAAAREAKVAQVNWQTASEQNTLRFEVERSVNAVDYQRVGSLAAAGNSTRSLRYAFQDQSAGSGAYYYRLKQVDADGGFTYSSAVALAALPAAGVPLLSGLYPNPFVSELNLELWDVPVGSVALTLADAQGRRVWATTTTALSRQLRVAMPAALARGTYLLTVKANGQQATRRVVKE